MKGWCAKITEGKTKLEINNTRSNNQDGFVVDTSNENNDTEIPFV
jgi:hypothetical protein